MTSSQTRTIGSSDSCDIVIDQATVSGQHCRVDHTNDGYTIEDLGSTNGTYVNGGQIENPVAVTSKDRITLGQSVPLPWTRIDRSFKRRTITVGRAPDNDIVLDVPNVSAHHARVFAEEKVLTIEDLGSTNGTALGTVEKKINRARITTEETVYFGSTPVPVSRLVEMADRKIVDVRDKARPPWSRMWVAYAATATVIMFAAAIMAWDYFAGDRRPPADPVSTVSGPTHDQVAANDAQVEPADLSATSSSSPALIAETRDARSDADALFWVVVSDGEDKEAYRMGTAWAVAPRFLVTSASVISAAQTFMNDGYPRMRAYSPATQRQLAIGGMRVHHDFEEAASAATDARRKYDDLLNDLQSRGANEEDVAKAKELLPELRQQVFQALETQVYFDVGTLEVEEAVETWLPLAPAASSLRPKMKVRILSLAFDMIDPFFDRTSTVEPAVLSGRIRQLVSFANDGRETRRLCVECDSQQLEDCLMGSPVLNTEGQVLAMYSRPTPSPDLDQPPPGDTFDAVLGERIRELVP